MGHREALHEALGSLFSFGRVTATKVATQTKQVLASIRGNPAADGGVAEERPFQVLWGHAAIIWRPPVDTEMLFTRRAEEMIPIASRDTRWQVELFEGEVCIRNLNGDTPTRIRLRADGEVYIETSALNVVPVGYPSVPSDGPGFAIALKALALAETVNQNFNTFRGTYNLHTHLPGSLGGVAPGGGAVTTGATATPLAQQSGLTDVSSARVFSRD